MHEISTLLSITCPDLSGLPNYFVPLHPIFQKSQVINKNLSFFSHLKKRILATFRHLQS